MSDENVIEIKDLRKEYKRGFLQKTKPALNGLSLDVARGEVVGFLGPNGAGKTTTLKILLNFLKPTDGEAFIFGEPVSNPAIHRRIGFLPETADYYTFLTPRQLITSYAKLLDMKSSVIKETVPKLLDSVGLSTSIDDKIKTFSKGMMQRVGIAQALLNDPELMILDEPASGLDPIGRYEIRNLIEQLKSQGKTIFFSSHELSEVEAICDRVIIINKGKLVKQGTLDELVPFLQTYKVIVSGKLDNNDSQLLNITHSIEDIHGGKILINTKENISPTEIIEVLKKFNVDIISITKGRQSLEDTFLELIKKGDN